ncbi:MAG: hypothetical protein ACRDSK_06490 [Actinophytocola sp.]|uniref:hypothetical protein n=1 Tax=Actinophytocola sp. TaxID=1872138 RepID=UPI003D6BF768
MDGQRAGNRHCSLEAIERGIAESSGFRQESGNYPLVYGYVRSSARRPTYASACRRVLERFCQEERLRLCAVFIDMGAAPQSVVRPGFVGLCDVLRLPDSFAALAVDVRHLSSDVAVAATLAGQVRDTGARLLLVRPPRASTGLAAVGRIGTQPCTSLPFWWQ